MAFFREIGLCCCTAVGRKSWTMHHLYGLLGNMVNFLVTLGKICDLVMFSPINNEGKILGFSFYSLLI